MVKRKTTGRPAKATRPPPTVAAPAPVLPAPPRRLDYGEPAPFFAAVSDVNPRFMFDTVAGRWAVLLFIGAPTSPASAAAHQQLVQRMKLFDGDAAALFIVADAAHPTQKSGVGYRYFIDPDQAIARLYAVRDERGFHPTAFLLDRALRVASIVPVEHLSALLDRLEFALADEAETAGQPAPVVMVPRIFEPELCQLLIGLHQKTGGAPSGFMREIEGRTRLMHDTDHKRRRDVILDDETLRAAIRQRIERRLSPMIERSFSWRATRIERYLVAGYSDEDKGFFRAHRDNTTAGTAHRRFAVSINLNADYDGGELAFPEFGQTLYKPPPGGAVVFNCSLLHEARPVTRGMRYVFVPFLYDEAGAKVREANLSKLDLDPLDQVEIGLNQSNLE